MVTLALLGYVAVAGSLGVRLLRGRLWMQSAPARGARVWTGLAVSLPAALLAGALNLLTSTAVGHTLGDLLHACVVVLRQAFVGPVSSTGAEIASLALMGIVLHTALAFTVEVSHAYRARRRYRTQILLLGTRRTYPGAVPREDVHILQHQLPFAFCLPGRAHTIVLSSSALTRLSQPELGAVLDHERSHLRRQDHLTLALSRAVARGLWFLPDLRLMTTEHQQLVEMVADDRAVQRSSPETVAAALIQLVNVAHRATFASTANGSSSASSSLTQLGGLGAVEEMVAARVKRLTHPRSSSRRVALSASLLSIFVVGLLPPLLVSIAWVAAATASTCPID